MRYQIQLQNLHCHGCQNLVLTTLEDLFTEVEGDMSQATFDSQDTVEAVEQKLKQSFEEINKLTDHDYQFSNLKTI